MVSVKALRNCKFSYKGAAYVFKEGEERDIDVDENVLDLNSFEVVGSSTERKERKEKKGKKKEDETINEELLNEGGGD